MRTIELTAVVGPDHTITVKLPDDVPPGELKMTIVLGDVIVIARPRSFLDWPAYDTGPWPEGFTASREQLYGDDGR